MDESLTAMEAAGEAMIQVVAETKAAAALSEDALFELLKLRCPPNQEVLLRHVRSLTGYSGRVRTADAVSMSLWPSRGIFLSGYEIKVSRSDWQRELANPAKAEEFIRFCRYWWVVAPNLNVVRAQELPEGWGLLIPSRGKLTEAVPAVAREADPLTAEFVASMLRNAVNQGEGMIPRTSINDKLLESYKLGRAAGVSSSGCELDRAKADLDELRKSLAAFEAASGVRINKWDGGRIGDAVYSLLQARHRPHRERLLFAQETLARVVEEINVALAAIAPEPETAEKGEVVP